jgi:small-conductance mechanosensitive channel
MNLSAWKALWPLLLAAVLAALVWRYGAVQWQSGYAQAKAEGDSALAGLRLQHSREETERAEAAMVQNSQATQTLQREQQRANDLAAELASQQRHNRQTTDRLSGEIARVNDLYREALDAPAKPLPACVFTVGWVHIYDQASGAALPDPADSSGTAAPPNAASAAAQLDSGLSQRELLAHHIQYAELCRNTTRQLELLIDQVTGKP